MNTIEPKTLKGFRDFLPADMRIRQYVFSVFRNVFEKYGYEPLETPTLEYADILKGKYGAEAEQLMYQFTDRGGREVAMKYDLTVPSCRVLAQYGNDIPLPFKRYQIQPVWRAENTQKGRFREFYQCDADTFGSSSQLVEAEYLQMGLEALTALGFTNATVRLNNRKIIDGMVSYAGGSEQEFTTICIAVDKLDKIGLEGVTTEMKNKGISDAVIEKIIEIISIKGTSEEILSQLSEKLSSQEKAMAGIKEIQAIYEYMKMSGAPIQKVQFDPTIIRGLSYYTGPVWEFAIEGGVGSVGGGGRYDELVKLYSGQDMPAAGGSFGVERLIELIKDTNMRAGGSVDQILVALSNPDMLGKALQLASKLRSEGKQVSMYPDATSKLEKQLKYADKKKIAHVAIVGDDQAKYKMKNMKTGESTLESL